MFDNKSQNVIEVLLALVLIRFVILALAFVFLVPKQDIIQSEEIRNRGLMRAEITWETGKDIDVDLWLMDPSGERIGWSNKSGTNFDLVRDDLGNINNDTGHHYEIIFGRALNDGDYTINVYLYANREPNYNTIPVKFVLTVTPDDITHNSHQEVFKKDITLSEVGEEITILRFKIRDKQIVRESMNALPKPIYGAKP